MAQAFAHPTNAARPLWGLLEVIWLQAPPARGLGGGGGPGWFPPGEVEALVACPGVRQFHLGFTGGGAPRGGGQGPPTTAALASGGLQLIAQRVSPPPELALSAAALTHLSLHRYASLTVNSPPPLPASLVLPFSSRPRPRPCPTNPVTSGWRGRTGRSRRSATTALHSRNTLPSHPPPAPAPAPAHRTHNTQRAADCQPLSRIACSM
jgi:hypothetical protein